MCGRDLAGLKLEKYGELLRLALGRDCSFALCDSRGVPVWASGEPDETAIETALAEAREAGVPWEDHEEDLLRCGLDGDRQLLCMRIATANFSVGWLGLLLDGRDPDGAALDALRRIAVFVRDEYELVFELNSLSGELEQRNEELNLVYSLGEFARVQEELQSLLRTLLHQIAVYLGVDLAAFIRSGGLGSVYAKNSGSQLPDLDLLMVELSANLFRFVCTNRQTLVLNLQGEERRRFLLPHMPYKILACPVMDEFKVESMLVLARRDSGADFMTSDKNLARVIADHVAITLQNDAAVDHMRRFGHQMAGALIKAVEAKDPYTAGHSERVQRLSVHIGRALGLQRTDLEDLFWGAGLHDVGKIGIPDVILGKPGALTKDEYTFIQTHPERSYEILRHIDHFRTKALEGARFHHERLDGQGYPRGLRGTEIPLNARVIATADTYDAITSSRSYRAARSHEAALAEVRRVSGSQLDPEVVRAFAEACGKDPALRDYVYFHRADLDG